ncbi:helix-turn-helix transcriptional regulator [Promicromonospora sp. MEB111]|uniref:helix-turn-helix transcriptional regulator n=1 Tax=Promicromonospora sp. MEB111 TaxID=3040301 RepID=UPI002549E7B7|nr:helix-turn-helix transcriptional regulator [Promicromonospora sp. MEB111]
MAANDLREFLTSRRGALDPHDVGLPPSAAQRRVPGLRREEVAALAGVSTAYYTKLEQGRAGDVSNQVLDAVARALHLDDLERLHLHHLVRSAQPSSVRPAPLEPERRARAALAATVHALHAVPAMVLGPRAEVLAANRLAALLLDDFAALPRRECNIVRWTFLNPRARQVYADWADVAAQVAASWRALAGARPDDAVLRHMIGELAAASPQFREAWAAHRLYEHTHGSKTFRNDLVGAITLHYESMALEDDGQTMVIYTAERGSRSDEALQLLASWGSEDEIAGARPAPERGVTTGDQRTER